MVSEPDIAIADLQFLVPIHEGQKVLILGDADLLMEEFKMNGIEFDHYSLINTGILKALEDSSYDIAIVPRIDQTDLRPLFTELSRIVKPFATLIVGLANPSYLYRWLSHKRQKMDATTLHDLEWIEDQGFRLASIYGSTSGIDNPRNLIDIEDSGPAYHYFRIVFATYTFRSAFIRVVNFSLARFGLQKYLFPSFVWVFGCNKGERRAYVV